MTKEIKEILDRLDYNEWEVALYKVPITWCELYNIRDYITNLQEENKRLKEQKEHLLIDLEGESEYKVMCEKAIEYIGNPLDNYWEEESKYLLNILQGEDKESK